MKLIRKGEEIGECSWLNGPCGQRIDSVLLSARDVIQLRNILHSLVQRDALLGMLNDQLLCRFHPDCFEQEDL